MLKEQLQSSAAKKLNVTLDGQDLSGEYILLEAMNIRYIGPNLYLAPDANPGDGLLDVVLLSEGEQDKLSEYLSDRLTGKLHPPRLTIHRGKHLQIQWEGFDIHIDHEILPDSGSTFPLTATVIDVKVDRHSLEFLIPAPGEG